ncbi:MAG: L,D-transpeptidase [Bryobacteraceae bacterium]|jgi:lipoprotein-anchoring transpeptidase ErfK/SrfK
MSRTENHRKLLTLLLLTGVSALAGDTRRIVISIPDHKLVLLESERVIRVYDVATGKPSTPSPAGEFHIVNRVQHPTWYGPGGVVRPGPSNPLGTRWMGLSAHGYGIHGTNVPQSIGKSASHGCIRMRTRDVEELFELVPVGATVELVDQPYELFAKN